MREEIKISGGGGVIVDVSPTLPYHYAKAMEDQRRYACRALVFDATRLFEALTLAYEETDSRMEFVSVRKELAHDICNKLHQISWTFKD